MPGVIIETELTWNQRLESTIENSIFINVFFLSKSACRNSYLRVGILNCEPEFLIEEVSIASATSNKELRFGKRIPPRT